MKKVPIVWLVLIQFALAFEWLHASWGKWTETGFMDNIGKTLQSFASKTDYPGYGNFLNSTAIPNAEIFGNAIRTGELAVGLALALSGILILTKNKLPLAASWIVAIACFGGALMNINFFLASGWSSPSTWGLNMIMAFIQIILGVFYINNRQELNQK